MNDKRITPPLTCLEQRRTLISSVVSLILYLMVISYTSNGPRGLLASIRNDHAPIELAS